jgi:uncharacterized membrane protein
MADGFVPVTVDSKTTAISDAESAPAKRWPVHKIAVGTLTGMLAVIYSVFSLTMFYTARTAIYDLGIFYQAVKSYSEFKPGYSVAKGLHNFGVPNFSVLGDHWSPIDAVLAPLIWIHDDPRDLLVAQAVLFALAIPFIWSFSRTALGGGRMATAGAYCVAVAYGLSWQIAGAAAFNFHEVAFAPVLTAIALERLQKGKLKTALAAMVALLLVKEDMGFFLAGIGLCLLVNRSVGIPRRRLVGLGLVLVGVIYAVVAVYVFIPGMGGKASYYWAYGSLGPDAPSAIRHMISHPLYALDQLITPRGKLHTELELFAPFLFLSLLSPWTLPAVPLILERFLASKFPNWWTNTFHYNAYLVVPIALGAVDGAARLDRGVTWFWRSTTRQGTRVRKAGDWAVGKVAPALAVAFAVAAVAFVPHFAFHQMYSPSFYHRNAVATAEAHAASLIPPGVVVQTTGNVGPFLLKTNTVEVWDGYGQTPWTAPWIIANDKVEAFGWYQCNYAKQQPARIAWLKQHGYAVVWYDKATGFIVLHAATLPKAPNVPSPAC